MKKTLALLLACLMVVSCFALTACKRNKKREGEGEYTYRMGPSDLPTAWNPHTYESNSSTYVLDYTGDALYTFDYKDVDNPSLGFEIVPSMAADVPEDVTADYAGQFGIPAVEEGEEPVGRGRPSAPSSVVAAKNGGTGADYDGLRRVGRASVRQP